MPNIDLIDSFADELTALAAMVEDGLVEDGAAEDGTVEDGADDDRRSATSSPPPHAATAATMASIPTAAATAPRRNLRAVWRVQHRQQCLRCVLRPPGQRLPGVRVPDGELDFEALNDRFHAAHEKAYTFRLPSGVEIVNYHVAAVVPTVKPALAELESGSGTPRLKNTRSVDFDVWGVLESAVYERSDLFPGCAFHGPAIIEEPAASTVMPPGVRGTVDAIGNIVMTLGDEA